ncbi:uncharacterized protein [Antennarius striatus]|uniref:uncharacterized protein n=1 Tax=Antennarius striatus TaxID=241820 RepID=UPI0035B47302
MHPEKSLSLVIKQISSNDWEKKVMGMGILQVLARNHSLILKPKLHLVCSFIIAELKTGCPAVVSSAINTLHELYVHLKTAMDPETEVTGQALLLKTKENISATTQEEINAALEALVQNCGYICVADVLLNTGVGHRSVAIRYTTAKLLHQLANRMGVDRVMTAGRGFNERFLVAVSKLSMDVAQEVKDHGQKILRELSIHKTFQMLCKRALPERNRNPLARILGNPAANDCKRRDEPRLNTRAKVVPNVYGHKTTTNKVDELPTGNQKMIPPTTKNKTAKPLTKPRKIITNGCTQQTATNQNVELQPLTDPEKSLSLSFTQLSSDDWEKKVNGMNVIRALARHHSLVLKPKLKQVCQILSAEVKNLRSVVSCLATSTLRELYINLQTAMDVEAETTGRALLLKLGEQRLDFEKQSVQTALDAMVENCSCKCAIKILLDTGLNHRSVPVRGTTAKLFHQVVEKMGVDKLMTASRHQAESLLLAISKLAVDPAQEVRHYGRAILQDMSLHEDFEKMWLTVVPDKDRHLLQNVLNKQP